MHAIRRDASGQKRKKNANGPERLCIPPPVDCVDGYERGTDVTCEEACDGQCCVYSSTDEPDPEMNDYPFDFRDRDSACLGFTGLVHRDGSCNGRSACESATISEVKGPSCTGFGSCDNLKSSLVNESCNRGGFCFNSEVSLIERSCNGPEYSCNRIIATSIVDETFDPPQQSVCEDKCTYAYKTAGTDAVKGVEFCTDEEVAFQPNYCTVLLCWDECKKLFTPNPTPLPTFAPTKQPSTLNPTPVPTVAPTTNPPTQRPTSCEEHNDSLRETVADLEGRLANTWESQCNADDGQLAFGTCHCNELAVRTEELTVIIKNTCKDIPIVDCDYGWVRGTDQKISCRDACNGQCCVDKRACYAFTGKIYRDGKNCIGEKSCEYATIDEVKGSSCVGKSVCRTVKASLVTDSCNGYLACAGSKVSLIVGSCNGDKAYETCYRIIATSVVGGQKTV